MNKDKIIKVSIIFVIIFSIFGFFIVQAANKLSLKVSTNASGLYVESNSTSDTINGAYFNENNILVLNYVIMDGFNPIKDSELKIRIVNDKNYNEDMLNSCVKILYPGEFADIFQLVINYKNYLDFNEMDMGLSGGDTRFPTSFKLEVYSDIGGDESILLTRDIKINRIGTSNVYTDVSLSPVSTDYSDITIPFSFVEETSEGYNLDVVMGTMEDKKYYIFDYNIFDDMCPRQDIKIYGTLNDSLSVFSNDKNAPGAKLYMTSSIGETVFNGLKLVLEVDRKNNEELDKTHFTYGLNFKDIYGNNHFKSLDINYLQYKRLIGDEILSDNAVITEMFPTYKASNDGSLNLTFSTSFLFNGISLIDSDFKDITEEHVDLSGWGNIKVDLKDLDEGRYTLLFYGTSSDFYPAASYSFYYEKKNLDIQDYVIVYGNKQLLKNSDIAEFNEFNIKKSKDYVLIDRNISIGNRKINTKVKYHSGFDYNPENYPDEPINKNYKGSGFDYFFNGLFCMDTIDAEKFFITVSSGNKEVEYVLKPVVSNNVDEFNVNLELPSSKVSIPAEDKTSIILSPIILRNGEIVDNLSYSYEIYKDVSLMTNSFLYINDSGIEDKLYITSDAIPGTYTIKLKLNDYPDIFVEKDIVLKNDFEDDLKLEILNDSKINIPSEGNQTNITLKTKITRNGIIENGVGKFSLLNELSGISLNDNIITVYSNASANGQFVVKFEYDGTSVSKTFTLVNDGSGQGTDTPTDKPTDVPGEKQNFASIVFKGFDSNSSQTNVITFNEPSGTGKQLKYYCYDTNGNLIDNPVVEIFGSQENKGILIEPNYDNKTVMVYANGLYGINKTFYINVTSNGESVLSLPVVAAKPDNCKCTIDFENYNITKNSSFTTNGSFVNFTENPMMVSLVTFVYDSNNKLILQQIDSKEVGKLEEALFKNRIQMPSDVRNLKIKAFFIEGNDITKTSRMYTGSKTITNRGGF